MGWTQQETLGETGRCPRGHQHPAPNNAFERGTACSKVPSDTPSLLRPNTFGRGARATSHAPLDGSVRKFSPELALCPQPLALARIPGASENAAGTTPQGNGGSVTFTPPARGTLRLHFPGLTLLALGPRTGYFWGGRGALPQGHLCPPCSCAPGPVRARQLNASRGKESAPGNCWPRSLDLGERESQVARASSHPRAFPSGVPSSLPSPPRGFRKPSLTITAPGLGFTSHLLTHGGSPEGANTPGARGAYGPQRQVPSGLGTPKARPPGTMPPPWVPQDSWAWLLTLFYSYFPTPYYLCTYLPCSWSFATVQMYLTRIF